jgi:hypothetical protein
MNANECETLVAVSEENATKGVQGKRIIASPGAVKHP